jgi:hypothetical protein
MGGGGHVVFTSRIKPGTPVQSALVAIEPVFLQLKRISFCSDCLEAQMLNFAI